MAFSIIAFPTPYPLDENIPKTRAFFHNNVYAVLEENPLGDRISMILSPPTSCVTRIPFQQYSKETASKPSKDELTRLLISKEASQALEEAYNGKAPSLVSIIFEQLSKTS